MDIDVLWSDGCSKCLTTWMGSKKGVKKASEEHPKHCTGRPLVYISQPSKQVVVEVEVE